MLRLLKRAVLTMTTFPQGLIAKWENGRVGTLRDIKPYPDFEWPPQIQKAVNLGLCRFQQWYILFGQVAQWRLDVLMETYPDRRLVPFAARYDNDDLACFEVGFGGRVFIVHMGADPGWERRQEYGDFWDWFQVAVDELIEEDRKGDGV